MNAKQINSLNAFIASQIDSDNEIKEQNVNEWDNGEAWATVEFGRKNDEGTMLEVVGRSRFSVLIGTRGGMTIKMAPKWVKGLRKIGGARVLGDCHYSN